MMTTMIDNNLPQSAQRKQKLKVHIKAS